MNFPALFVVLELCTLLASLLITSRHLDTSVAANPKFNRQRK